MRRREEDETDIKYTERAGFALRTLSNVNRAKAIKIIELFYSNPEEVLKEHTARELAGSPDIYVIRITNTLRVIVSYSGLSLKVLDIVSSDRLKRMWGNI